MKEIWKPVVNYEGLYEISDQGRVKSLPRETFGAKRRINGRILSPVDDGKGYLAIKLSKDGVVKKYLVHRIVAEAFIPNQENLPYINHKDENRSNNHVENLEWCTPQYNVNYGCSCLKMRDSAIKKGGRPICCYDKEGNLVKEYACFRDAVRDGFRRSHIENCINGKEKTYKRLRWSNKSIPLKANSSIPIIGIPINGGSPIKYDSIRESGKDGFCSRSVCACVNGHNKSHKGYKWYKRDDLQMLNFKPLKS